jgi:hypothetical protein
VVCLYVVVFIGGFLCVMMQGVGNAMVMRGGACAAELCFMGGGVVVLCHESVGFYRACFGGISCVSCYLGYSLCC